MLDDWGVYLPFATDGTKSIYGQSTMTYEEWKWCLWIDAQLITATLLPPSYLWSKVFPSLCYGLLFTGRHQRVIVVGSTGLFLRRTQYKAPMMSDWGKDLCSNRRVILIRQDKYVMEFFQNKIVEVLDSWVNAQTWVMLENLCSGLKVFCEILLIQLDWAWVNLWEELEQIGKSRCAPTAMYTRKLKSSLWWFK